MSWFRNLWRRDRSGDHDEERLAVGSAADRLFERRDPLKEDLGRYKTFWLTNFAVDHPISVLTLFVLIVLGGLYSYMTIPKEASPDITVPFVAVNTIYSGVAPEDIETLITRPLEEELNKISDIKTLTSQSVESFSRITAEFEAGMDMTEALQLVREKVDIAKPELPEAAEEPAIVEFNFSEFPIMQVNVSGEYSLMRLKELAEDIQDEIEQIRSVLSVQLSGGLEREVKVDVDLGKLKYYGITFNDVIEAIAFENVTVPGGTIDVGDVKYLVRVPGEFEDTRQIEDIVIEAPDGWPIYVRDVATVDFGFKERETFARLNGNSVVTLSVSKRTGENIIETSDAVRAVIAAMEPDFPPTTHVSITSDSAKYVRSMVSNLENNIISGLILVVSVLLFVLGVRNASFVGVAIPLSMLLSFSVMQILGFTMNMVVLFSLILALGMLVDNAIVVVENIYRFREEGFDRKTASKLATAEVAMPVIAATATTLAAFAPMAFWPGITGEFMSFLPKTLMIALTSSLFVGLVINPTLCSLFMRLETEPRPRLTREFRFGMWIVGGLVILALAGGRPLTTFLLAGTVIGLILLNRFVLDPVGYWVRDRALPATLHFYEGRLRWALRHRLLVMGQTVAVFAVVLVLFGAFNAGIEFFPEDIPPDDIWVQVETPVGTRPEVTDGIVKRLEQELQGIEGRADYESVVATTGSKIADMGSQMGSQYATVAISFVDFELREHDTNETLEFMRSAIGGDVAGATITVAKPNMGPPTGKPINIEIIGEDFETLKDLGDRMVALLSNADVASKLDGLESDLDDARPELRVDVDREKAALFGVSTLDIGNTVRSAINGTEASTFRDGEEEYDIVVRLAEQYRSDLSSLADLTVESDMEDPIPLTAIATWHIEEGFSGINRKDMDRVVTVSSDVRAGYNGNAVLAEVQETLTSFDESLPAGYRLSYTGQQQEQQESQDFLFGAFLWALFLIGFILISQFDSILKPGLILSTVLLSTIGVLIGLLVFRMPFGVIMTGVGVISLAGIVVNNGILLIDYIHILRERDGLGEHESLVMGGVTRFRPVTLTAITTVLGLVPLAIGLNIDFNRFYRTLNPNIFWGGAQAAWWGPMAIAVIAGLTFATFLTLVLLPVMHSLLDETVGFVRRHFRANARSSLHPDDREGEEPRSGRPSYQPASAPSIQAAPSAP